MRASQICICTSYDERFSHIGDLTSETMRAYGKRYGFPVEIDPRVLIERHPAWHRVKYITELFGKGYEYILWLDADALFVRYDIDIREVINGSSDLYLVQHDSPENRPTPVPNTGVMLIRNCRWSVDLFNTLWSMTEYLEHHWWENGALIKLLGYNWLLDRSENKFNEELLSHITFLPEIWNFIPSICTAQDPIVVHYAGYSRAARLENIPPRVNKSLELARTSSGMLTKMMNWVYPNSRG